MGSLPDFDLAAHLASKNDCLAAFERDPHHLSILQEAVLSKESPVLWEVDGKLEWRSYHSECQKKIQNCWATMIDFPRHGIILRQLKKSPSCRVSLRKNPLISIDPQKQQVWSISSPDLRLSQVVCNPKPTSFTIWLWLLHSHGIHGP